jgi:N-acetylglutamate synthase-like GNAT family acetyltransferase
MIRKFKKEDAVRCAEIINKCHKSMPELKGKELEFLLNKYTPEYANEEFPKNYVLVYEKNGEVSGLGALQEGAQMRWLYVDPAKQRQGIGKALVNELEKEAKRRGYNKVILKSYYESESFYEKMGYKLIKKDFITLGDATIHFILMEKDI